MVGFSIANTTWPPDPPNQSINPSSSRQPRKRRKNTPESALGVTLHEPTETTNGDGFRGFHCRYSGLRHLNFEVVTHRHPRTRARDLPPRYDPACGALGWARRSCHSTKRTTALPSPVGWQRALTWPVSSVRPEKGPVSGCYGVRSLTYSCCETGCSNAKAYYIHIPFNFEPAACWWQFKNRTASHVYM